MCIHIHKFFLENPGTGAILWGCFLFCGFGIGNELKRKCGLGCGMGCISSQLYS